MATTTEPPTLHKSSGVAPRNGTTTHVINFTTDGSAPFTPATGSLLVLFIGGGVTNANAGGWNEVEQPVSTGELSAFTITSAPTTSVTITHNASNYPCAWIVKEYPAGSVVTSSTPSTSANDTFPTLSGLTGGAGNERVIDAAFLRIADGGETNFSAVWGGSFVEDADQYFAQATTDGFAFTSGHQINVTATSSTPSITPTYSGTWTVGDREKIVLAINAVAPSSTTPVSGTLDLRWNSRTLVSGTMDLRWNSYTIVSSSIDFRWNSRTAVAGSLDLRWNSYTAVGGTLDLRWNSAASTTPVSGTLDLRWNSRTSVAGSIDFRWNSYTAVTGAVDLRWNSRTLVGSTLDLRWNSYVAVAGSLDLRWNSASGGASAVSGTLDLRWNSYTAVSSSLALVWNSRTLVAGTLDLRWNVRSQISGSLDLRWVSRAYVAGTLILLWNSAGNNTRLPADLSAYLDDRFTVDLRDSLPAYLTGLG
jgi:hypothetical protein